MKNSIMLETKKISEIIKSMQQIPIVESNQLALAFIDEKQKIGIGKDFTNQVILVLPGQEKVTAFETKFATFDPWQNLIKLTGNRQLSGVAQLNCKIELNDDKTIEALAAIFLGIIDLQIRFGQCGEAIWQMKSLFESGFAKEVQQSVLTGLVGEIMYILSSDDPVRTFDCWHSNSDARYDFSSPDYRVDVKSTIGQKRLHSFRSSQLPGSNPEKTYIVSCLICRTEVGCNLQDLVEILLKKLDTKRQEKAIALVIQTLGVLPEAIQNYFFDLEESMKSLQSYNSNIVPTPIENPGVISMKWEADLTNVPGSPAAKSFYKSKID